MNFIRKNQKQNKIILCDLIFKNIYYIHLLNIYLININLQFRLCFDLMNLTNQ